LTISGIDFFAISLRQLATAPVDRGLDADLAEAFLHQHGDRLADIAGAEIEETVVRCRDPASPPSTPWPSPCRWLSRSLRQAMSATLFDGRRQRIGEAEHRSVMIF